MRTRKRGVWLLAVVVVSGCGQKPLTLSLRAEAPSLVPIECAGDEGHCDVVTSYRGVNVYRNAGPTGFCSEGGCAYPRNRYGVRWQCVELFNRFFATQFGVRPVPGDAKDLLVNAASVPELEARVNGGVHPPLPGDALVLGGTRTGHVAIVVEVTESRVYVVEQNASVDGTNNYAYDPRARTVTAAHPMTVLGWIHATANLRGPPPQEHALAEAPPSAPLCPNLCPAARARSPRGT